MKTRHFALLAFLVAMPHVALGQSDHESMPSTVLGFLKPGTRVGIRSVEGTADVVLTVYDDEQYSIARVLGKRGPALTSAAALAKEYPAVRKQLNAYVEKLPQKDRDTDAEKIRVFPMVRTFFGTIRRIGDDFVLIELEGEAKQRRVLPKSKIGHIDLDGQAVRFLAPREARR